MAAAAITNEIYEQLMEAYRDKPGNVLNASKHAHVSRDTARRAWELGVPQRLLKPCKVMLEEEQLAARALAQKKHDIDTARKNDERLNLANGATTRAAYDRESARADAIEARARLSKILKVNREDVAGAAGALARVIPMAIRLAERFNQLDVATVKPEAAGRMVYDFVSAVAKVEDAVHKLEQTEALHIGNPTEIIGLQAAETISLDEAESRHRLLGQALERARARALPAPVTNGSGAIEGDTKH